MNTRKSMIIKNITVEQIKTLSQWEKEHPNFQNNENLL